jgi:hypothetical protein
MNKCPWNALFPSGPFASVQTFSRAVDKEKGSQWNGRETNIWHPSGTGIGMGTFGKEIICRNWKLLLTFPSPYDFFPSSFFSNYSRLWKIYFFIKNFCQEFSSHKSVNQINSGFKAL